MSVACEPDRIVLSGHAGVEDAETLLGALLDHPTLPVDVGALSRAHLAVVQILHAAGRPLVGVPDEHVLRTWALVGLLRETSS